MKNNEDIGGMQDYFESIQGFRIGYKCLRNLPEYMAKSVWLVL